MENKHNKNLFWYGFFGQLKIFFGILLIVIGVIGGAISLFTHHTFFSILFLVIWILGFVLGFKGKSQRFDYQRQSGTILHRGDW